MSRLLVCLLLIASVSNLEAQELRLDTDTSAVTSEAHPGVDPAVTLYEETRHGVVKVLSGISSGSGFIVSGDQLGRVIVTNAHVVSADQDLSVVLADSLRVPAQLLLDDERADLAILKADISLCGSCRPLELSPLSERPAPGTPVFAVGYPLGLGSIFSAGIVTGQTPHLLLSDVDINPGNSGGPLVDQRGRVVGVNTFIRPSQAGPGVSGIIDVSEVRETMEAARLVNVVTPTNVDSSQTLPMLDLPPYPLDELLAAADSVDFEDYEDFGDLESQDFHVTIFTPVSLMALAFEQERQVVERRRKREQERDVMRFAWYTERTEFRTWHEDIGDITRPYVMISIRPKTGKTTGTIIGEILGGLAGAVASAATGSPYLVTDYRDEYEFKGDLAGLTLFRVDQLTGMVGMVPLKPIIGGTRPLRVVVSGKFIEFRDVAYGGAYVLHPDVFRPDPTGTPPHIVMRFQDLTNDKDEDERFYQLPPEVIARVWNDFRPYFVNRLGEQVPHARTEDIDWHCARTLHRECDRM